MAAKTSATFTSVAGLNKALRKLPKLASAHLRDASKAIAADVAAEARGRANQVGGVAKYVAPTIKATRDRVPVIQMGSRARLPNRKGPNQSNQTAGNVIFGAEFGGQRTFSTTRGGSTMQFRPWRGSSRGAGYFLWPAVRANADSTMERYAQALLDAVDDL